MLKYTLIKLFSSLMKSSCLSYQENKKNKECGHTRGFQTCYIQAKLLYSNIAQRHVTM